MKKKSQQATLRPYISNAKRGGEINIVKFKDCLNVSLSVQRRYFLIARDFGRIKSSELEAARKILRRKLTNRRRDRIIVRARTIIPLTKKPIQARMGRGKGSKTGIFICLVKPGKPIFEIQTTFKFSKGFLKLLVSSAQSKLSTAINLKSLKNYFL